MVSTRLKHISQIGNLPQIGVKIKNIHLLPSKTDLTGAALDIGVPFSTPFGCAHRRFSQKAVRMVHTNPAPKMTSADQCWNKMANQAIMK